jgi:drug/metabolite transporter (DMT)-like permease
VTTASSTSRGVSVAKSIPAPDAARLVLAAACWGAGTALSKQAVSEFPPVTLLATQLGLSVLFLVAAARIRGVALPRVGLLGGLGILNPGLAYALGLLALTQISASLAVVLWAVEPLLIVALAVAFLGEHAGRAVIILSAVAVTGMVLVLYDTGATGALAGVAIGLAGVACCAIYTVATRRWLAGADSTTAIVVWQQAYGFAFAVALLIVAGAAGSQIAPTAVSPAGLASVVASGLVYYGVAYTFYVAALRNVPASIAAFSFYLIPVFGLAAAFVLGDRLSPIQWVGAIVVVVAVASLATRRTEQARIPQDDAVAV